MKDTYPEDFKSKVKKSIAGGMTLKEAVKTYGISLYFARKWSGEVYKKIDTDALVRTRYRNIAVQARTNIEIALTDAMKPSEKNMLSDTTWNKWDAIIKDKLYEFAEEIIRAN